VAAKVVPRNPENGRVRQLLLVEGKLVNLACVLQYCVMPYSLGRMGGGLRLDFQDQRVLVSPQRLCVGA
jgi:hypothetical protein